MNPKDINKLSEELLLAVKMQEETSAMQLELEKLEEDHLKNSLDNDEKKKAFWINIYNAYYQILRKEEVDKSEIYKNKLFNIAGTQFSLDDVEHGVLRRNQYKDPKEQSVEQDLIVDVIDYRIHFALNCGAKSCPPIAFYKTDSINAQLDLATQSFLEGESDFDDQKKEVHTTALFQWFANDFGGEEGIKQVFKQQLNKDIGAYSIKYKEYSWEDSLANFI